MECSVCCSTFTKIKRIKCECKECGFNFCSECLKNDYIKVKKISKEEISCFQCKVPFNQKILKEVFSKSFFVKEILDHLAEAEIQKEKNELQKAQSLAVYNVAIKNWKRILEENYEERKKIQKTIDLLYITRPRPPEFVEELSEIKKKCPLEGCRGFLDETDLCENCNKRSCKICEKELLEDHICDRDLVLTLEEKRKDSRPCPKCEIPISKKDGCNQMWCPMCNTVFDYKTGNIDKGRIHNPEYLDYMRRQGNYIQRAEGDVRFCDDLNVYHVSFFTPERFFYNFKFDFDFKDRDEVILYREEFSKKILQKLQDIIYTILDIKYRSDRTNSPDKIKYKKRSLQADFINKKITEQKWKIQLKSFLKIEESNNELIEIYTSFMRSLNDVISNCVEITLNLVNSDLKIFKEQLYDNIGEILKIHNTAIRKNRNEFGLYVPHFYPYYFLNKENEF